MLCGLATMLGPVIGGIFYYFFGYKGPFFIIGSLYAVMVVSFAVYANVPAPTNGKLINAAELVEDERDLNSQDEYKRDTTDDTVNMETYQIEGVKVKLGLL